MLTSHEALAWYLEGVRTHVSLAGPAALAVRVRPDGDVIYVADNEADRLIAEEFLPDDADRVIRVPWQVSPAVAAAEQDAVPEASVARELRAARAPLLPGERDRYRRLGRDCAEVLTDVLRGARPERTEQQLAATVVGGLAARGIDPLVVLVAGAGRLAFRHPLPTAAPLGQRAMVVVCGRRSGLIANATRWVGAPVEEAPILDVERVFLDATVPGSRLDDVFEAGVAGYGRNGFDAEEWRRHHQGGPAGYAGRDPRAMAGVDDLIVTDQAFAWNPTAPGVKVEDTMLRTADGWEVLTEDPRWPSVEHRGLRRPVTLPYG
ncbi:M24 family metallopeptidase [Microbacterium aurantiacum]|uniref:M24 family metallopeptidase n=1 Tax=Microbacterium aurantiacum TaxID=162393 RepID=UPI000C801581|nr:M24 family metallopeptidase [Microbacterium aurantiacum]